MSLLVPPLDSVVAGIDVFALAKVLMPLVAGYLIKVLQDFAQHRRDDSIRRRDRQHEALRALPEVLIAFHQVTRQRWDTLSHVDVLTKELSATDDTDDNSRRDRRAELEQAITEVGAAQDAFNAEFGRLAYATSRIADGQLRRKILDLVGLTQNPLSRDEFGAELVGVLVEAGYMEWFAGSL